MIDNCLNCDPVAAAPSRANLLLPPLGQEAVCDFVMEVL